MGSDSSKRNLLSIVDLSSLANADPSAVEEVKQLLLDLIDAGEAERAKAVENRDSTQAALDSATAKWTLTYDELAVALGEVKFQEETNAQLRITCTNLLQPKMLLLRYRQMQHKSLIMQKPIKLTKRQELKTKKTHLKELKLCCLPLHNLICN